MRERLERLLGARIVSLERVSGRGYTHTGRYRALLDDGRSFFVKAAVDELSADWLRAEHVVYADVRGAFLPEFHGYDERDGWPLLVLEDLSGARWPPPWTDEDVDAVRHTLGVVAATKPPPGVTPISEWRDAWVTGWPHVAKDPEPFLALGLCSREWLDAHVPELREAAERAPLEGRSLVHLDVRSDNTALADRGAVLVDWSFASAGNPVADLVCWAPSLCIETGIRPSHVVDSDGVGELAALISGVWAAVAGLPPPPTAEQRLRDTQLAQLRISLPWACRELSIPEPG